MNRCLIAVSVMLSARPALADWEFTKWGMTPTQVMAGSSSMVKAIPTNEIKRDDDDHWEISLSGDVKVNGMARPASFMFDTRTGGLRCVISSARGSDAGILKQELLAKYGPGTGTIFGDMQSIDWVAPDEISLGFNEKSKSATVMHCRPGG